jgi:Zn-finger protein
MEEQVCPRCQEGRVGAYVVSGTAERVWVCDECEATWRSSDLGSTEFEQLQSFAADGEGESLWDDLEQVEDPQPEV